MDEISKKVLIKIDLANEEANAAVADLANKVDALKAAVISNKQAISDAKATQAQYTAEIAKGRLEQQNIKTAIDQARLAHIQATAETRRSKEAYVAAAGSYDEAQKKLRELGKAIKSVEGGLKSTDPEIQKQIAEYKALNDQLKAFDAKLGNHQRNVGNYEKALTSITGQLGQIVPGFNQFSSVLQSVAQGFSAMKGSAAKGGAALAETGAAAEGGEAAMGAMGAAALGLTAGLAAVAAVGVGLINYFKDISTFSDKMSNAWAGAGATWTALVQTIGDGDFGNLEKNMERARDRAKELNQAMIDLKRNMLVSEVESNAENQFIATQMLKMRNLHTTSAEAERIFKEVQDTANKQYARVSKEAEEGYNITANKIALTARLTKDELTVLAREGVAAAEEFKKEGKHIADDLITEFAQFQSMRVTAEGIKDQTTQRAQNREEQRIAKNQAAAEKAKSLAAKEQAEIEKIRLETEQAKSERIASITRMLDFQREAFGKELSDTEEHYRQLIFKQEQFIERQEAIVKSKKSTAIEKAAAQTAIGAGRADILQLRKERYAATEKLLIEHNRIMIETAAKGALDLKAIQIEGIENNQAREIAALENGFQQKMLVLQNQNDVYQETIGKLNEEIKTEKDPLKIQALKTTLNEQYALLGNNAAAVQAYEKQKQKAIDKTIKKFEDQKQAELDSVEILRARRNDEISPTGKNDKAVLEAEQKALLDKYNADVSEKGLTDAKKLELEQQYLNAVFELNRNYNQKRLNEAIQWEQKIQSAASNIIAGAIASNAQYEQTAIDKQKNFELQNQALTSTQRYEVEEKFRIKSGQAKVKEFENNKKLQMANAVINLMVGEGKLWVDPGFPAAIPLAIELAAQSAIQMAEIASQKPPAYASGGLHYTSDGRGGVLPGYSKHDNTNAYLRSGEGIVVSEAMQVPWARNLVSAINQSYGGRPFDSTVPVKSWLNPGFATGGIFSSYTPTVDNGLRTSPLINTTARLHPDDVASIANAIANIPAPIVDVKDVNREQGLLSVVQDRSSR